MRNSGKFSDNKIARLRLNLKTPAVTRAVQADPGIESITVTWGEVAAAGGYHVMWKSGAEAYDADGSAGRRAVVVGGKTLTHTITGLTAGVEYDVLVAAYNEAGQSSKEPLDESEDSATPISPPPADNTVLVGNATQTFPGTERLSVGGTQYKARAQAFTTGSESAVLGSVTLPEVRKLTTNGEVDVHLYTASGVDPGVKLHTLTPPDFTTHVSGESATFTAPAAPTITLAANTTYFVYVESTQGQVTLLHTKDDDEDPASDVGWSIADRCRLLYFTSGSTYESCESASGDVTAALVMVLNEPLVTSKPLLSIAGSEAVEGSGVQFTVSLSAALVEEVTVNYSTADDSATAADSDYTAVSAATLTFAANETEQTFTIATTDDSIDEDDESFSVVLSSPSENTQLGYVTSASGLIINNDETTQTDGTLSSITLTGSDGNTIALTPTFGQYTFLYTATADSEIDSLTGVVTPSTSGIVQSILYVGGVEDTVSAAYDAVWPLVTGDNLIKFMVTSPDGSRTKIYKIHVNKDPSTDATLSDLTLVDNNGTAITLSPAFDSATTEYAASVGAAVSSVTLTGTPNYSGATMSNNLGPDRLSGQATLETWAGESAIEILVTAEDGVSTKLYTVTAERILQISFGSATYSVDEGAMVEVSVLLNGAPGDSVRADLSTTEQGGATTADYSVPRNVVFASGETSKTITFNATDDATDDDGESVKLTFGALPTGVSEGPTGETVVSITDDDAAGVSISESSLSIAEGSTDTYTVALNSQPVGDVTVTISGAGADLSVDTSTLTFTTTTWASAQTVTVTAVDDEIDDDGETVTLAHAVASADYSHYQGVSAGSVAVSITDNDDPQVQTPSTDATLSALTVNDGTNDLTLAPAFVSGIYDYATDVDTAVTTVTLTTTVNHSGAEVTGVTLAGTAITDTDFTDGITVPSLVDGDNEIVVTVTAEDDTTTQDYTVTVTREPPLPVLSFASIGITVNEEAGPAALTVNLSPASAETVTVDYATRSGTATEGEDYTATSGTLTFAPGETSKNINVPIVDDNVYEATLQRFYVDLENPSGAALPANPYSATIFIQSDDPAPTASMQDVTVSETDGTMVLTLRLSHESDDEISYFTISSQAVGHSHSRRRLRRFRRRVRPCSSRYRRDGSRRPSRFPSSTTGWKKTTRPSASHGRKTLTPSRRPPTSTFTGTITDDDTADSTDATLSALALKDASDDSAIALNETFAPTLTSYTADVANGVDLDHHRADRRIRATRRSRTWTPRTTPSSRMRTRTRPASRFRWRRAPTPSR